MRSLHKDVCRLAVSSGMIAWMVLGVLMWLLTAATLGVMVAAGYDLPWFLLGLPAGLAISRYLDYRKKSGKDST